MYPSDLARHALSERREEIDEWAADGLVTGQRSRIIPTVAGKPNDGEMTVGRRVIGQVLDPPTPPRIGILVDLGRSIPGFVDVLRLPDNSGDWPITGTVTDFEVVGVRADGQVWLRPIDPRYRNERAEQLLRRLAASAESQQHG